MPFFPRPEIKAASAVLLQQAAFSIIAIPLTSSYRDTMNQQDLWLKSIAYPAEQNGLGRDIRMATNIATLVKYTTSRYRRVFTTLVIEKVSTKTESILVGLKRAKD